MTTVRYTAEEARRRPGRIDRAKVDAFTEEDIQRMRAEDGEDDADWGPPVWIDPRPPDVGAIRARLGLTQEAFAARFGLARRTVQEWEQGRRVPDGPAKTLLRVIARDPDAVARALSGRAEPDPSNAPSRSA